MDEALMLALPAHDHLRALAIRHQSQLPASPLPDQPSALPKSVSPDYLIQYPGRAFAMQVSDHKPGSLGQVAGYNHQEAAASR